MLELQLRRSQSYELGMKAPKSERRKVTQSDDLAAFRSLDPFSSEIYRYPHATDSITS